MNRLGSALAVAGMVAVAVADGAFVVHTLHARHTVEVRRDAVEETSAVLRDAHAAANAHHEDLRETRQILATRTAQRQRAQTDARKARQRKTTASRDLAAARLLSSRTHAGMQNVRACVHGVATATLDSRAGMTPAAISALRLVQSACTSVRAAEGDDAVFPFDFSDPSVLRVDNVYYAYSTNAAAGNIQTITSTDLTHWTILDDALPKLPAWALPGSTWAPAVMRFGNVYVAYYTVRDAATWQQCISVALAFAPGGPFVDNSPWPLVCQHELGGSIDPRPFVDGRGQPWLLWKSESARLPAIIWSQPLTSNGRGLAGAPTALISAGRPWEHGVVEAPVMVNAGGRLVLFYSGNRWNTADYAVGTARCASPAGPCVKRPDPVFVNHDGLAGPGAADFFTTPAGEIMMAYGAYREPNVGYPASRLLHLARVHIDGDAVTFTRP